jgi:hypothetical protein
VSILCQLLQLLLDLACDSLATRVDAVVGEAAGVALRYEDGELLLGKSFAETGADIFEVLGIAPKPGAC